jgi:hypothetical protein
MAATGWPGGNVFTNQYRGCTQMADKTLDEFGFR